MQLVSNLQVPEKLHIGSFHASVTRFPTFSVVCTAVPVPATAAAGDMGQPQLDPHHNGPCCDSCADRLVPAKDRRSALVPGQKSHPPQCCSLGRSRQTRLAGRAATVLTKNSTIAAVLRTNKPPLFGTHVWGTSPQVFTQSPSGAIATPLGVKAEKKNKEQVHQAV